MNQAPEEPSHEPDHDGPESDPKLKKRIVKDWLVILGIVVLGFGATYLFVTNAGSGRAATGLSGDSIVSLRFLVVDLARTKFPRLFEQQTRSTAASASRADSASSSKKTDPADLFAARILDGQTLQLSDGTTIQLIGVNASDTAVLFMKEEIEGRNIVLVHGARAKNPSGTALAYVYRRSDNLFLNAEIIRRGFGSTDTSAPFEKMEEFLSHEQQARMARRGFWAES